MVTLSPALRRILAVAILAASLAVAILAASLAALWGLVVEPVTTKFESYDQSIAQSQALLARYLRIGAARERLVDRYRAHDATASRETYPSRL